MYANAYALFNRPNPVLEDLPQSANLIYDLLAAAIDEEGCCSMSLPEICATAQICRRTAQRGIKRLSATHLINVDRGNGRGRSSTYLVRAFFTAPKAKRRPVAEVVVLASRYAFAQERVTFPPHPPIEEAKAKELKTQRGRRNSPGAIMKRVRCVTNQYIDPQHQLPIQNTIGRMLFKEGRHAQITSHPGILREIFHLLVTAGPPRVPPQGVPQKRVYAWIRGEVEKIIRRHTSGVADLMSGLLEHVGNVSTEKGDTGRKRPQTRFLLDQHPRRESYSKRGLVPSWAR